MSELFNKDMRNLFTVIFLMIIIIGYIIINTDFRAGIIYITLLVAAGFGLFVFPFVFTDKLDLVLGINVGKTALSYSMVGVLFYMFVNFTESSMAISPLSGLYSLSYFENLILVSVVAGVVEEIAFRGLLLSTLRSIMPVWGAIGIESFMFSIYHKTAYSAGETMAFVSAFIFGVLTSVMTITSGSLTAAILTHVTNNGLRFILIYSYFSVI